MVSPKIVSTVLIFTALAAFVVPLAMAADTQPPPSDGAGHEAPPPDGDGPPHVGPGAMTPEERAKWDAMTPAQKEAKRAELRAKWDSLTPQEKAARKEEMRNKWEALSDQQKAELREKFKEHHQTANP